MTYEKVGMFSERATIDEALKYGNDLINASYQGHSTGTGTNMAALTAMYVLYNTMAQKLNDAVDVTTTSFTAMCIWEYVLECAEKNIEPCASAYNCGAGIATIRDEIAYIAKEVEVACKDIHEHYPNIESPWVDKCYDLEFIPELIDHLVTNNVGKFTRYNVYNETYSYLTTCIEKQENSSHYELQEVNSINKDVNISTANEVAK